MALGVARFASSGLGQRSGGNDDGSNDPKEGVLSQLKSNHLLSGHPRFLQWVCNLRREEYV